MKRIFFPLVILALLCCACDRGWVPSDSTATLFTSGRVVYYGPFYESDSLNNNVLMLDIYSKGVGLDSTGHIQGSGTNLCLSDVFLSPFDTTLQEGVTYQSDSFGVTNTFLPGQNFDGSINGAYILQITDGVVATITLIKEGHFDVAIEGDTTQIDFDMVLESGKKYKAQFRAPLTYQKK